MFTLVATSKGGAAVLRFSTKFVFWRQGLSVTSFGVLKGSSPYDTRYAQGQREDTAAATVSASSSWHWV